MAGVALPDENDQWPPRAWAPIQRDITEAAAWWSGDPEQLATFYGGVQAQTTKRPSIAKFWAKRNEDTPTDKERMHVPAAADVAAVSADLLFGDVPTLRIDDAHDAGAKADAKAAQDRLTEILEESGVVTKLLEGAEVCSGLGGVYLSPAWDPELADRPLLVVHHHDCAVPEFRFGELVAVTFWSILDQSDRHAVWRHLERHERGFVEHGLYIGTDRALGRRVDLADHPATAGLDADEHGVRPNPTGIDLDVRYVPNVRPNRKHRHQPVGRSDCAGTEGIMDALDQTWSSWMRDIELGKARIIVPDQYLDRKGRGEGATFDEDRRVFSPLRMQTGALGEKSNQITEVQFEIRVEEHHQSTMAQFTQIVQTAGYSPQSFGLPGDGHEQTATEVDARKDRSLRTTGRKQGYWTRPIEDLGEMFLIVDREVFGRKVTPMRPTMVWPDPEAATLRDRASTLNLVNLAQAASIETKVRLFNPERDEVWIQEEVARIKDEQGVTVDPTGGFP